jgi:hypothetical protein
MTKRRVIGPYAGVPLSPPKYRLDGAAGAGSGGDEASAGAEGGGEGKEQGLGKRRGLMKGLALALVGVAGCLAPAEVIVQVAKPPTRRRRVGCSRSDRRHDGRVEVRRPARTDKLAADDIAALVEVEINHA